MRRKFTTLALGLALVCAGGAALGDGKDYPGAFCQPAGPGYAFNRGGAVVNQSDRTQYWVCPTVKDTPDDISGDMHVFDRHQEASVTCSLWSKSRSFGFLGVSTRTSGVSFFSSEPRHLDFNTRLNGIGSSIAYYVCSVPGRDSGASGIVSYELDEG